MDEPREVWIPISAAASEAGVARRSAFRWVGAGLIPVQQHGGRRCVEVGALRRMGAAGNRATRVAQFRAGPGSSAVRANSPLAPPDMEAMQALSASVSTVEELVNSLWLRVEQLERLVGARR